MNAIGSLLALSLMIASCTEAPQVVTPPQPPRDTTRRTGLSHVSTIQIRRWMPQPCASWGYASADFHDSTGQDRNVGRVMLNDDTMFCSTLGSRIRYQRDYYPWISRSVDFGRPLAIRFFDSTGSTLIDSFVMPELFRFTQPSFHQELSRDSVVLEWTPAGYDSIGFVITWFEPTYGATPTIVLPDCGRAHIPAAMLGNATGVCEIEYHYRKTRHTRMPNGRPLDISMESEGATQFVLRD